MSEKPAMAVSSMDDVYVAPNERPSRDGQLRLRVRAPLVFVRVTVFFTRTRAGRDCSKR